MPKIKHLWDSLVKQYGAEKGARVYYAMENEGKPPFKKNMAATARKAKKAIRKR